MLYKFVILLLCNLKSRGENSFLTSRLWDVAEAAGTAVYLVLWKRRIIQLLYDIPFGKQEKMRVCFLSRFLVWMLAFLRKKFFIVRRKMLSVYMLLAVQLWNIQNFHSTEEEARLQKDVV